MKLSFRIFIMVLALLMSNVDIINAETEYKKLEENPYRIFDNSLIQLDYTYDWKDGILYNDTIYVPFKETANLMLFSVEGNELCDLRKSRSSFIQDNIELDIGEHKFRYFVGADPYDCDIVSYVSIELQWCHGAPRSFFTTTFRNRGEVMPYKITGNSPYEIVSKVVDKFPLDEYKSGNSVSYYAFYDINTNCVFTVYECIDDILPDVKSTQDGHSSKAIGVNLSTGETTVYYSIYSDMGSDKVNDADGGRQGSEFSPFPSLGYIEPYVDFEVIYNGNSFSFNNQAIKISQEEKTYVYVPLEELCKILNYSYKFENKTVNLRYIGNDTACSEWAKSTIGRALFYHKLDASDLYGLQYPCNRIDMVAILSDLLELKEYDGSSVFLDTSDKKVMSLYEAGIVNGSYSTDGSSVLYKPFDYLTREEFAVVISNAMDSLNISSNNENITFLDSQEFSQWAEDDIQKVCRAGFMRGYPDGTFKPKNKISKEECIITLLMLMKSQGAV